MSTERTFKIQEQEAWWRYITNGRQKIGSINEPKGLVESNQTTQKQTDPGRTCSLETWTETNRGMWESLPFSPSSVSREAGDNETTGEAAGQKAKRIRVNITASCPHTGPAGTSFPQANITSGLLVSWQQRSWQRDGKASLIKRLRTKKSDSAVRIHQAGEEGSSSPQVTERWSETGATFGIWRARSVLKRLGAEPSQSSWFGSPVRSHQDAFIGSSTGRTEDSVE